MAKVTAPMLGFGASGQIGKSIVFGKVRGVAYGRQYAIPANPQTSGQLATRDVFSTLSDMYKFLGTLALAPWTAFARGKKFSNRNSFMGKNVALLRGQANMNLFLGSPGANGGPPAATFAATTGAGAGELTGTFTLGTPPTGWTASHVSAFAFPNQDPADPFVGPVVEASVVPPTLVVPLTGMTAATACQVIGVVEWTKPDGTFAYSVGVTDQATSGA